MYEKISGIKVTSQSEHEGWFIRVLYVQEVHFVRSSRVASVELRKSR